MIRFLLCCAFVLVSVHAACDRSLADLSYRLSGSDLQWPCQSTKNIYVSSGRYVPKNVIITRAQMWNDQVIVAMPRYKPGVPFTLGKMSLAKASKCIATLAPFPCWSMQEEGNCEALQSVVDIFLDPMDILWVLDVGIVNTLEQPVRRCPPKVVAVNMKTGKVVKVVSLEGLVSDASRLQYILVDYDEEGKPYVFVSDAGTRAIVVFDVYAGQGHRVVLPKAVTAGCAPNDVLYIALVRKSCGQTVLYFTYLNSPRLFSIKAALLRKGQGAGAVVDVGPKPNGLPIVLLGTDNGAAIFFRFKGQSDVYMWNTETCFKESNFVEVLPGGDCRLATQVLPGFKKLMWALESNFQHYIADTTGCVGASIMLRPVVKTCDA
ncbi:major royal jelly protein 2-like [Ctenocephalides felis]|uniref:major royal jelly protein 2-like n=1 Tax=Ctenocephalides felis TaxID=7515 RepID=UPI000E6E2E2B|nr:major royal jelly protein 2-like [Ctenocephalides felis]